MKGNKGITLVSLAITILVLLLLAGVAISLMQYSKDLEKQENETINNTVDEEKCEHDWVVTSKYNFLTNAYQTYSKCSKCGKEIK